VPADADPLGGLGKQHGRATIDGFLAFRAAARARPRGKDRRVGAGEHRCHGVHIGLFEVEHDGLRAACFKISGLARVSDDPDGLITACGEQFLEPQRDLAVSPRNDYSRSC
jgi:hypothetical protein